MDEEHISKSPYGVEPSRESTLLERVSKLETANEKLFAIVRDVEDRLANERRRIDRVLGSEPSATKY